MEYLTKNAEEKIKNKGDEYAKNHINDRYDCFDGMLVKAYLAGFYENELKITFQDIIENICLICKGIIVISLSVMTVIFTISIIAKLFQ